MIDKRTMTRRLSQMNTLDALRFGSLTVRLYVSESYVVWKVEGRGFERSFKYNRLPKDGDTLTEVDMLFDRRTALDGAVECIQAYQALTVVKARPCGHEACGQMFTPSQSTQKYCSRRCYERASSLRYQRRRRSA